MNINFALVFWSMSLFLDSGQKLHNLSESALVGETWNIELNQSSIDCSNGQFCYQVALQSDSGNDWTLGDQNYRFFFDGDLMTINTVISLLPSSFYSGVTIDQNITISGQGQEAFSPLDDIDDNLGFLDFSITQTDKSNPPGATQILSSSFTPVAEICLTANSTAVVDLTGTQCLHLYHSRPSTAGMITNQYTTISENDTPNNTVASLGSMYEDLTPNNLSEACVGITCTCNANAQNLSN